MFMCHVDGKGGATARLRFSGCFRGSSRLASRGWEAVRSGMGFSFARFSPDRRARKELSQLAERFAAVADRCFPAAHFGECLVVRRVEENWVVSESAGAP